MNSTQIGHISSEPLLEHNDDQSDVDQILSNEIVITSQPLIPYTTTNMIPSQSFRIRNNVPEHNHLTQRQLVRPIRRSPQRQQRRRQQTQRQQTRRQQTQRQQTRRQQTQRQQTRHQRQRQRRRERRQEERARQQQETQRPRQQQPEQQQSYPRYRRWSEIEREHEYWQSVSFEYYMEENMSPLLEAYEWEKMDPEERQKRWKQETLKELEGATSFEEQAHLTSVQDEMEQLQNIETAQTIREEK